ncbi:MAG: hydroxylase, partial [Verrucomicrobiales bacterium]|nr:hydroxylase [Verrucomicrobiales bacterium]
MWDGFSFKLHLIVQQTYHSIVIGGGPGGSTAGTLMAKRGQKVLLLEKEVFPRFHIGESLLPYNFPIFEEL